ncbi:MAG: hypothetical protein ACLS43_08885 [Evtepia gabavorous]
MKQNLPTRREMKFLAKRLMMHPICMRVTLLLVCVQLAFYGLRVFCGGTLTYGLAKLSEYGDTASGIYFNAEGFSILFRMDLTQTVLAIPVTYHQILVFLLVNALFFVLLAPLRLGAMEQYWGVLRGSTQLSVFRVFQWFRQPKRLGKAVAVEFVLSILVRLAGIVGHHSQPVSLLCLLYQHPVGRRLYHTEFPDADGGNPLAVAAALFTFWLHSVFLPVRYCLCAHPEYSLGQTFRRGLQSAKGVRGLSSGSG